MQQWEFAMKDIINNFAEQIVQRDEALRSVHQVSELAFYILIAGGLLILVLATFLIVVTLRQRRIEQARITKIEAELKALRDKVDQALGLIGKSP
jgi:hypothetical protein